MIFLILFLNLWLWRIFQFNLLIAVLTILVIIFYKYYKRGAYLVFFIFLSTILILSPLKNLAKTDSLENDLRIRRMRYYPVLPISLPYWIEQKPVSISLSKIYENFGKIVSPNLYFFANHPRGSNSEFEKFPYIYFPVLLIGFYSFIKAKKYKFIITYIFAPILIHSFFNYPNSIGPYLIIPGLILIMETGAIKLFENTKKIVIIKPAILILFILIFIQSIFYALK